MAHKRFFCLDHATWQLVQTNLDLNHIILKITYVARIGYAYG
jgi:hypothetical protein